MWNDATVLCSQMYVQLQIIKQVYVIVLMLSIISIHSIIRQLGKCIMNHELDSVTTSPR